MHYRDGTEAKIGDVVKGKRYGSNGPTFIGTVTGLIASTTCNLNVAVHLDIYEGATGRVVLPVPTYGGIGVSVTAGECDKVA